MIKIMFKHNFNYYSEWIEDKVAWIIVLGMISVGIGSIPAAILYIILFNKAW